MFSFFIQTICNFSIVLWQIWHCRLRQRSIALEDGRFTQADSNGVDERPTSTLDDAKQGISLVSLSAAWGVKLYRCRLHMDCVSLVRYVEPFSVLRDINITTTVWGELKSFKSIQNNQMTSLMWLSQILSSEHHHHKEKIYPQYLSGIHLLAVVCPTWTCSNFSSCDNQ